MESYAHMAALKTAPLPYSLYEQFPVCRLCYRLYRATVSLTTAAKEFAQYVCCASLDMARVGTWPMVWLEWICTAWLAVGGLGLTRVCARTAACAGLLGCRWTRNRCQCR